MVVAPDLVGDRMQVHHPHGDMVVHDPPSAMIHTDPNPCLHHDPPFAHDHTPLGHAHQRRVEVPQRQSPDTAGAGVPATAATAAAAEAPSEVEAPVIK